MTEPGESPLLESLGRLAGGVAHDFNNLLAVISSYAEFVGEEAAKEPGQVNLPSIRADVRQIQRAAERGAELTHQLLAFARRDVARPRPLNLNEVIGEARPLLIRTLGEQVLLRTDLAAEPCPVLIDPAQLEEVLVNLAANARDAMPAGGTLTVVTAISEDVPAGLTPGRYVRMTIGDTGTGIPAELQARIFEPFFTTKPKGCGTGLGLATVYGIVTRARGHVQVSSEPGAGARFTILLPATDRDAVTKRGTRPGRGDGGQTILVVEDEPAMLEVTRRILSRHGYRVITASNGRQAVEIAASHDDGIDVLLSDVVMPQMPGQETAARIRALRPGVKVLFMSGYAHGLLDTQGIVAADVNLLQKPFTEESLLTKLRQVIGSG